MTMMKSCKRGREEAENRKLGQMGESQSHCGMDSGDASHVLIERMFPRVKLERKTSPKRFAAANGEQISELGGKTVPFKTNEGIHSYITFRSASVVKHFTSMQKVV